LYKTKENSITKGFLQDIYKPRKSVGVILDNLGQNQVAFDVMWDIESFLPNSTEVVIFSQDWNRPVITPPTGVHHISGLYGYKGKVVAFTPQSVDDCLRCGTTDSILWYIYNPHEINTCPPEFIGKVMSNDNIIKVCRSENHRKLIKNLFPHATIEEKIIENFDIKRLIKVLDAIQK
tara:strand:- start:421 stop:951 length:531 start_codon:yes stop_codon:yes gene_type:complete